jgi:predicted acyl esterase
MNDYSDIIFLMASMIMLSMITLNTSKTYLTSQDQIIRTQLEYRTMSAAQDQIDAIRWVTSPNQLDPSSGSYIFFSYPITQTVTYGEQDQYSETITINASSQLVEDTSSMERYRVTVTASSDAVTPNINVTLDYLKSFTK